MFISYMRVVCSLTRAERIHGCGVGLRTQQRQTSAEIYFIVSVIAFIFGQCAQMGLYLFPNSSAPSIHACFHRSSFHADRCRVERSLNLSFSFRHGLKVWTMLLASHASGSTVAVLEIVLGYSPGDLNASTEA